MWLLCGIISREAGKHQPGWCVIEMLVHGVQKMQLSLPSRQTGHFDYEGLSKV